MKVEENLFFSTIQDFPLKGFFLLIHYTALCAYSSIEILAHHNEEVSKLMKNFYIKQEVDFTLKLIE